MTIPVPASPAAIDTPGTGVEAAFARHLPTLHLARLTLRPLAPGDAAGLMPVFSDDAVTLFQSSHSWRNLDDGEEWVRVFCAANAAGSTVWLVCVEHATQALIGACVLFDFVAECRRAEIGYMVGSDFWNRGYGREATVALVDHAFGALGIERLEAQIHVANVRSQRMAARIGFQREGLLRKRLRHEAGHAYDVLMYSLVKDEDWQARQSGQALVPVRLSDETPTQTLNVIKIPS